MTEWDAGQILIQRSDDLFEAAVELHHGGHNEAAILLDQMSRLIGDLFNRVHMGKSHGFGLKGTDNENEL